MTIHQNQKSEEFDQLLRNKIRGGLSAFANVLTADDLQKAEDGLFKNHSYFINQMENGVFKPDSTLFDYTSKIQAVVDHFAKDGLTRSDYLKTAAKQAQLFSQLPNTITANIEGVTNHFAADGLTRTDYLKAAIKQAQLFSQSPKTIIANIEDVTNYFAKNGLTRTDYLKAAVKKAQLFYQSPHTIIANIEGVTNHFATDGLTLTNYLKTAAKQAQLFFQLPHTIIANIEGVTNHFAKDGFTRTDYLKAATKQASLFVQSPKTLIRHIQYMQTMSDLKLVPKDPQPSPYKRLFDKLMKSPAKLSLGDDNFILRLDYGLRKKHGRNSFSLLDKSRSSLEKDYAEHYGQFNVNNIDLGLQAELEKRQLLPLPQKSFAQNS